MTFVELVYENGCAVKNIHRKLHDVYIQHTRPSKSPIKQSGSLKDQIAEKYTQY